MAALSTGLPLADRYLLIEQLGSGGMAVVWRGFDDLLGRPVAVKVLAAPIAADPAFREAIYREARSSARLSHPHITHVYDYGEAELPDGQTVSYVVMELLDGRTLADRLVDGPLPWPEAVRVAAQVAGALAAAHRRGIVHRDIAPPNVMLTATGAKVLDFGIAALAGGRGDPDGGGLMGTPAYVAPERLDDAPAAPAADVYALGALLYESLTGAPPVPARTWAALVEAYKSGPDVPPLSVPGLPGSIVELCERCLSRDPALRPGSAEVAEALNAAVAPPTTQPPAPTTEPAEVPREAPVPSKPLKSAPTVTHRYDAQPDGHRRRRAAVAGLAAIAVAGVSVLVYGVLHGQPSGAPRATSSPSPSASAGGAPPIGPLVSAAPTAARTTAVPPTAIRTVNQLLTEVAAGRTAGQIRVDVAVDLDNVLHQLLSDLSGGKKVNIASRTAFIRQKVQVRQQEGAISSTYAAKLMTTLSVLARSR